MNLKTYSKTGDFVLSLMIENTPCFGFFNRAEAICMSCSLMQSCQNELGEKLKSFVEGVQQQRAEALRKEEEKIRKVKEKAEKEKRSKCFELSVLIHPTQEVLREKTYGFLIHSSDQEIDQKLKEFTSRFSEEEIDRRWKEYYELNQRRLGPK